jgi:hypothetical protein
MMQHARREQMDTYQGAPEFTTELASPSFTSHQTNKPSSYCASTQHFGAMVNIGLALLKRKVQQNLQMYMAQHWKNTPTLNHI